MTIIRNFISLAFSILVLATFAVAQGVASGDLHVTVKDPSGNLVTNATVTARDQAKGTSRNTTSNVQGEYRILALAPGKYTVVVQAPGFARLEVSDVTVTIGQLADLPVSLTIAGGKEVVTVSSDAELVETQRTSSTDTIEQ